MRTVTTNFRDAILNGENQVALVDFGDWTTSVTTAWWFDETDIAMDGGIRLGDNFCTDENLTLGTACNSIEISVLNQYTLPTFSEFQVFIGAATSSYTASTTKDAYANVDGDIVEVRTASASPYLYLNNTATTVQPSAGCKALEILRTSTDNQYIVLAIKEDNTAEAFTLDTSAHTLVAYSGTYSTPTFFQEKWASWDGIAVVRGIAYYTNYYTKFRNRDGNVTGERYELCSLGYFIPSTTHITNEEVITIQGYDRMVLFDKDASTFLANRNPYHTLKELFDDLCSAVGVTGDYTYSLSGNRTFVPTIEGGSSYSLRQVLSAVAEALGCVAKFNNKGVLYLYWFYTNNIDIDYNFQRTVYNYSVSVIDKVQIGSVSYGSGDNVYYNDTNFLGLGATQVQNLYTRLNGFAAYSPCNASIFGTPSIEAGDIVVVKNDSLDAGVTVPIFVNNYAWNGSGSATIESTGDETRPIDSDLERRVAESVTSDDLKEGKVNEIFADTIAGRQVDADIIHTDRVNTEFIQLDNAQDTVVIGIGRSASNPVQTPSKFTITQGAIEKVTVGATSANGGYINLQDSNAQENIQMKGQTGEIICVPQNFKSKLSIANSSGVSSASILGAYYSAGLCWLRVSLVNSASVGSGGEYSAQITFPNDDAYEPLVGTNSGSYFGARFIHGTLSTGGLVTYRNCGTDSMTANHTVNMTFVYPCWR